MTESPKGKLYVVATPIGNLGDITLRALETLKSVGALACEDTRQTQKLLARYDIRPREIFSLHKFNEKSRRQKIVNLLNSGVDVALVSDAGTPTLADPGHVVVAELLRQGFCVVPIPGPSALATALCASGMEADRFLFDGFLPHKPGERRQRLGQVSSEPRTLIFYETPHRLEKSLQDMVDALGNRPAVLAREMTKIHEEIVRGDLESLLAMAREGKICRGEIVLIVEGNKNTQSICPKMPQDMAAALEDLQKTQGLSRAQAMRVLAKRHGVRRRDIYQAMLNPVSGRQ